MLGYGKDSHTYRVFNLFHYKVVETVDVQLDKTNGSQREHLPNVLDEATPGEAIKMMGIGEIIPTEEHAEDEIIISAPINLKTMLSLKPILKMNVGFRVPQTLERFELWGACGDLNLPSLPNHDPPKPSVTRSKRQRDTIVYPGLGHLAV